jgi:hypothetical protein
MFKVTILDLDTMKTCVDEEAVAIVAGIRGTDREGAHSLSAGDGTALDYACAAAAAETAVSRTLEDDRVRIVYALLDKED